MHSVMPDGSVDVVIKISGGMTQGLAYGSTTSRHDVPLEKASHYIGISFKAGQSRHFINASAAELTNANVPLNGLLKFQLVDSYLFDNKGGIESNNLFSTLNFILENHIKKYSPVISRIDHIVQVIDSSGGVSPVTDYAEMSCKSMRQFERMFRETVGISAKLYSQIVRCQRAITLISSTDLPLVHIAAELGYSDQCHMTNQFRRFANSSPASLARKRVAFLQD